MKAMHIVVIGFGPVAARFLEEIAPRASSGHIKVTVLGSEPDAAYNRVLVGEYAAGRVDRDLLSLCSVSELEAVGIQIHLSVTATRIDRIAQRVETDQGTSFAYDHVILATGAEAVLPNVNGINPLVPALLPSGVTALRNLQDAELISRSLAAGEHIVILGGGVLGVESALAFADRGAKITLVHAGKWLLGKSLDQPAGALLVSLLAARGVTVHTDARATAIHKDHHGFTALELADSTRIGANLLLVSIGVRPRIELAERAGLATRTGIVVNHDLSALGDPHIHALGDCAEVRCRESACERCLGNTAPAGLIGVGWSQAALLAHQLSALLPHHDDVSPPVTLPAPVQVRVVMLKAKGMDVVAGGEVTAEPWNLGPLNGKVPANGNQATEPHTEVSVWADPRRSTYVKMVSTAGKLTGFIAMNMPSAGAELTLLFEQGAQLPMERSIILNLDLLQNSNPHIASPQATLCRCAGVRTEDVSAAIQSGATSVKEVSASTRAGTGCGGCQENIESMLATAAQAAS